MELEEKVKKLEKEFPGLSKLLIKRTLCDDDVREDLTEARQKLQKFTKGPFLINPAAAADDKELEGNRYSPHLDGLSNIRNTLCEEGDAPKTKNSFRDSLDGSVVRGGSATGNRPTPFQLPNTEERALNGRQAGFVTELSNLVSTGLKIAGPPKYLASENSEIPRKRSVIDSNTKLGGIQEKTNAKQVPDPPKPKPKPNWRKQRECNEDYKELKGPPAVTSGVQAGPPTLPISQMQSLLSSTLQRKRLAPPPPTASLHAQSRLPMTSDEQQGPPTTPLRMRSLPSSTSQGERAPTTPSPAVPLRVQSQPSRSQALKRLAPSPPNLSQMEQLPPATPPHKQSTASPPQAPPPPALPLHAPVMPQLRPKQLRQLHSNKGFLDGNDAVTNKISKRDDAALKDSKNMNVDLTDLEEKVRKLKEEFSSLPKVLIKKTLCGDDIDGDLLKARLRLQDFNKLKDQGDRFISSAAGEITIGKLNRDMTISPPLAGWSSSRPGEQSMKAGRKGGGNLLPENWTPMPLDDRGNDVSVHLVELDTSSSEYQEVEDRVLETANHPIEIVSIERVQNPFLYQSYQLAKQKVERNNGESNERQLFHGTSPVNIKKINAQGFDRSLSGSAHGAVYGTGVYFARDASYSIGYASQPSVGTHRVMYLARVVVGQYCKGERRMKKPPPVNLEHPEILFDSMVDKLGDPSIFVVYFDYHSYPEYLISFDL